jgi:hypothetical protein
MPWKMLNEGTDFFLPQVYFEQWTFAPASDAISQSLAAVHELPSVKEVFPVWGSGSSDHPARPATAAQLQPLLDRYPGSSIYRIPDTGQPGEAWDLRYGAVAVPDEAFAQQQLDRIGYVLRPGAEGEPVEALRNLLTSVGYSSAGPATVFDSSLEKAVRAFQQVSGIAVDGVAGPETLMALAGKLPAPRPELGLREQLAYIAQQEGDLRLRWTGLDSQAEKYLEPLRAALHTPSTLYQWCGAFVLWCCRKAGYHLPDGPPGSKFTFAYVPAWAQWAKSRGYWLEADKEPARGDIALFHWAGNGEEYDHIGVVSSYVVGSPYFCTSEGNRSRQTCNGSRQVKDIAGFIRLPTDGAL